MKELPYGFSVAICQMQPIPGDPARNSKYMIQQINEARSRRVDIIVFPELATTGYFIGDVLEDEYFLEDVIRANKRIVSAACGITVIFGTVTKALYVVGEDGRHRMHNAAIIAADGKEIERTVKTLQPNYRFFNDDKHFYSLRKIAEEVRTHYHAKRVRDMRNTCAVRTSKGDIEVGVILCEDMWHKDYVYNPSKELVAKGAQIIFNLSASPWTWQKNRKRHQVVNDILKKCKVPFVYVNQTGVQNTGKNVIVFDGSSTVYQADGSIATVIKPYAAGTFDVIIEKNTPPFAPSETSDVEELYRALWHSTKKMTPPHAIVVDGLSGGIDSAVTLALLADCLGADRVHAINMPYGTMNSSATREYARQVAHNLRVSYEVIPIDGIVNMVSKATGVKPGCLAFENIQARARKDILAARAQAQKGIFVCNSNKVEMAFGYGTMYGDLAGYFAPLGDLVKREIRQIADYINRERCFRAVIPEACIDQVPTAELSTGQKDPFDYGSRSTRGYHDEMVRAFTEFRRNPEWFLDLYIEKRLESELMLPQGTIRRLFPDDKSFVRDLTERWHDFCRAYFKRVQSPPIAVVSKRAFGRDLEESIMDTYYTERYREMANRIMGFEYLK